MKTNASLRSRAADHLVQAVLIFASVFFAFWLNDYRQDLSEKRATQAAIQAVANEIKTNKAVLKRWAPYHKEMANLIGKDLEEGNVAIIGFDPDLYIGERGIFKEILTYDSWDFIRQTNIRLDVDMRIAINRIFRQQEIVERAIQSAVEFLWSRESLDPALAEQNLTIFYALVSDLYHQEQAMIYNYVKMLELLEGQ